MHLRQLPLEALAKMAAKNRVSSYAVHIDTGHRVVSWKLRLRDGRYRLCHIAPALAVHFAKSVEDAGQRFGWPTPPGWPDNPPRFMPADMDAKNRQLGICTGMRVEAFRDAIIAALADETGLVLPLRFAPPLAMSLARLHRESIDTGELRDLDAERPPSSSHN